MLQALHVLGWAMWAFEAFLAIGLAPLLTMLTA